MQSNVTKVPLKQIMLTDLKQITYELTFSGARDMLETRQFDGSHGNDAITQTALKITELNNNPNVKNAFVTLSRLPDAASAAGRNILSWTKPYTDLS